MTLRETLNSLDELPEEAVILAAEPWTLGSKADIEQGELDDTGRMKRDGLLYFLEVSIARELREDMLANGWRDGDRLFQRIIDHAINDA